MDIDAPGNNGLALARRIKQRLPNIGVVAITSNYNDHHQLFRALKAQAAACISNEIGTDQ